LLGLVGDQDGGGGVAGQEALVAAAEVGVRERGAGEGQAGLGPPAPGLRDGGLQLGRGVARLGGDLAAVVAAIVARDDHHLVVGLQGLEGGGEDVEVLGQAGSVVIHVDTERLEGRRSGRGAVPGEVAARLSAWRGGAQVGGQYFGSGGVDERFEAGLHRQWTSS